MMKYIYKITFILLLCSASILANEHKKKHEKKRIIEKEFKVNKNATVALNNKYGNLNITTWNLNKVVIEITITVKGNDLGDVEDKLETIDVEFESNSNFVSAKTIIESSRQNWSWFGNSKNVNYKINYEVKMPETNAVDLDNDYGSIYLDNLEGTANINCDYGKISIGELHNTNNVINLNYCSSSTIEYMNEGTLNLDYSKINLDKAKQTKITADYSTVKLGLANKVDFNLDYGSISANEVDYINGNSDYASVTIGILNKKLNIETDYGAISIKKLAKNFESVQIDTEYAGVRIGINNGTIFNFEINLQYATFSRNDNNIDLFKSISKTSHKYYQGKYGKGTTTGTVNISSQYGGVTFREY